MKRFKILIVFLSLCSIIVLNISNTYSYFVDKSSTDAVSFTLGNVNVEADDNNWKYVPIHYGDYDNNNSVYENKLTNNLIMNKLRPGDGFEKIVNITNTGTLTSKIQISKASFPSNTVYSFDISTGDDASESKLVKTQGGSYVIDNVKPGEAFKIKLRLEVPGDITYDLINNQKLNKRISSNPMDLISITATQYSNPN